MHKTILLTGATDGIGLETAKALLALGHNVLLHGRSSDKLAKVAAQLASINSDLQLETYVADLSQMADVKALAESVCSAHEHIDVVINNAGIYVTQNTVSIDGFDIRFAVNTLAPYLLTKLLLPIMPSDGRVVNLSSAAQANFDIDSLTSPSPLSDSAVYAQSKLAITMWSRQLAQTLGTNAPAIIAVNPASMLGSKMVKQAYGVSGGDLSIGADILVRAALSAEFADASGKYFDNDAGQFRQPHADVNDTNKTKHVVETIENALQNLAAIN
ncbi:SDR family NAD(P)-dependent oxidoreductase [Shewanella waksmanii]|uniref:SDR family NAD(P)-dependent oxidoreductase n=1 Tax=Shewanella waksmanii TaxID=213783 RepID=UPI00048AE153|nr:SDR family NAD(P)-dependent oxidoreductase [Shewanella waksmanii]